MLAGVVHVDLGDQTFGPKHDNSIFIQHVIRKKTSSLFCQIIRSMSWVLQIDPIGQVLWQK